MIRMTKDYGPWKRGEELEALAPGSTAKPRRTQVDADRYAALVTAGLAKPVAEGGGDAEADAEASWPLVTSPADYLERYPDGPKADLARAILETGGDS